MELPLAILCWVPPVLVCIGMKGIWSLTFILVRDYVMDNHTINWETEFALLLEKRLEPPTTASRSIR